MAEHGRKIVRPRYGGHQLHEQRRAAGAALHGQARRAHGWQGRPIFTECGSERGVRNLELLRHVHHLPDARRRRHSRHPRCRGERPNGSSTSRGDRTCSKTGTRTSSASSRSPADSRSSRSAASRSEAGSSPRRTDAASSTRARTRCTSGCTCTSSSSDSSSRAGQGGSSDAPGTACGEPGSSRSCDRGDASLSSSRCTCCRRAATEASCRSHTSTGSSHCPCSSCTAPHPRGTQASSGRTTASRSPRSPRCSSSSREESRPAQARARRGNTCGRMPRWRRHW